MGVKGCLSLMASHNVNVVIASIQIELGVDLHTAELVKEVCHEWDQVPILPGNFVEIPEVHTELQATILMLGNEDSGTGWQLG